MMVHITHENVCWVIHLKKVGAIAVRRQPRYENNYEKESFILSGIQNILWRLIIR